MRKLTPLILLLMFAFFGCQQDEAITPSQDLDSTIPINNNLEQEMVISEVDMKSGEAFRTSGGIEEWMASVNEALLSENLQIEKIEFLGAEQAGNTIFFQDNGNKQLSSDYVPNDPRNGNGTQVPYVVDGTQLGTSSGMSDVETYTAIVNTMNTWDAAKCSMGLEIPNAGIAGFDIGFVQFLLDYGGYPGYFLGFVAHSGVLPSEFFDLVSPGGGSSILGVTFTFTYTEDLDQDGRGDVAIKEIYINDGFNWQDAPDDVLGNGIYDFETVVLHEVGHALSQAHFGKAFANDGGLHFAPAALMNAGYSVGRRDVSGTDNAGHCSNWGDWPNN